MSNAEDKAALWGFIRKYAPGVTPEQHPVLTGAPPKSMQNRRMKLTTSYRWLPFLCLFASLAFLLPAPGAETKKDAQTVLAEMRLKKFTKDLSLNPDQQKKVQALFDEENGPIAKLNQDTSLTTKARADKVSELRSATYTKIKPLLDTTQLATFEKMLAKAAPKKKE